MVVLARRNEITLAMPMMPLNPTNIKTNHVAFGKERMVGKQYIIVMQIRQITGGGILVFICKFSLVEFQIVGLANFSATASGLIALG